MEYGVGEFIARIIWWIITKVFRLDNAITEAVIIGILVAISTAILVVLFGWVYWRNFGMIVWIIIGVIVGVIVGVMAFNSNRPDD